MGAPAFRSDILVKPVPEGCCGSDRLIALSAWADDPEHLPAARNDTPAGHRAVIRSMLPLRHNSPFEAGLLTVYVEAPGVAWWQWTRQRFMSLSTEDFSFDLASGRYKLLDGVFYLPPEGRPCLEPEGFRPLRPDLEADALATAQAAAGIRSAARTAWVEYEYLLRAGVAREVARLCLPNWSLYCAGFVNGKPLTWLQWFSKRRKTADTQIATYPQWEIEQAAAACEALFAERWPLTHAAFLEHGRVAP